jgi:hypothetical protein
MNPHNDIHLEFLLLVEVNFICACSLKPTGTGTDAILLPVQGITKIKTYYETTVTSWSFNTSIFKHCNMFLLPGISSLYSAQSLFFYLLIYLMP